MWFKLVMLVCSAILPLHSMEERNDNYSFTINLIEAFMQGKIEVQDNNIVCFRNTSKECDEYVNLEKLAALIKQVEEKDSLYYKTYLTELAFKKVTGQNVNADFLLDFKFFLQLDRLKQFTETRPLNIETDYGAAYSKIEKLKQENGNVFMQGTFGSSNIYLVTQQFIERANNRVRYIQACRDMDARMINMSTTVFMHFKFVTFQEDFQKYRGIVQ